MSSKKSMVRVPKGTSSYQAAWIADAPIVPSDEEESDEDSESDDEQLNQLMVRLRENQAMLIMYYKLICLKLLILNFHCRIDAPYIL